MAKRYPQLKYYIVCDDIRREVGNRTSLIGIYPDDILLSIPSVLPKLCIHSVFSSVKTEDDLTIELFNPKNELLARIESPPIKAPAKTLSRSLVMDTVFTGVPISQEGTYRLIFTFGKEEIAKRELKIEFKKKED